MTAKIAAYALTLADGTDLGAAINPRLLDLRLSERRADAADQLDITLSNHDRAIAPVNRGARLSLSLGWAQGRDVALGLVDKGSFLVDEVEESGSPDIITIRARSADLNGVNRTRRNRAWTDTTVGAIVTELAAEDGNIAAVHPDLAAIPVAAIEQGGKSNKQFLSDLGQRYDAVATWKALVLIFMPVGATQTASGLLLPSFALTRQDGNGWTFREVADKDVDGVSAQYHDQSAATAKTVRAGGAGNTKRLKKTYASEADADAAVRAEAGRMQRGVFTFDYQLALGDARISPNARVSLSGWNSRVDAIDWLVDEVEHSFGPGGLMSGIKLESAG